MIRTVPIFDASEQKFRPGCNRSSPEASAPVEAALVAAMLPGSAEREDRQAHTRLERGFFKAFQSRSHRPDYRADRPPARRDPDEHASSPFAPAGFSATPGRQHHGRVLHVRLGQPYGVLVASWGTLTLTVNPEDVLASGRSGLTVNVGLKSSFSQPGDFRQRRGLRCDVAPEKFPGSSQSSTLNVAVRGVPHDVGFVNSGTSGVCVATFYPVDSTGSRFRIVAQATAGLPVRLRLHADQTRLLQQDLSGPFDVRSFHATGCAPGSRAHPRS